MNTLPRTLPHRSLNPRRSLLIGSLATIGLLATAGGCSRTVGDALRPDDHTAASSMGLELVCADTPSRIKPLIVDWTPDERVELEAALQQNSVVVVKYDCPTMEILPGCSVDGSYSYAGVSRKEQVIQMENMDDIHANIPVSSATVGAEIQSGRAINLATVLVGRRSTTVNHLTTGALVGQCEGATHFVRSASLGAFSMATGSKGKAAVVAEMFGYGGGASSDSERSALNTDGDLESCRTSDPRAGDPPMECQAPVRIELMPIVEGEAGEGSAAALAAEKKAQVENPCLPGYVYADGMCQRPSEDLAYLCDPGDEAECRTQCDKGSAESCLNLGMYFAERGEWGTAQPPLLKACDGEIFEACTALGEQVWHTVDYERADWPQISDSAWDLLSTACLGGHGYGCELSGDMASDTDQAYYDMELSFALYDRACDLGSSYGCWAAAKQLFEGEGVEADPQQGFQTLLRSCEAGSTDECNEIGRIFEEGMYGVSVDLARAAKWRGISCMGEIAYCETAGRTALKVAEFERAALYFAMDCKEYPESDGCGELGKLMVDGRGVDRDVDTGMALIDSACNGGTKAYCDIVGRPVPE